MRRTVIFFIFILVSCKFFTPSYSVNIAYVNKPNTLHSLENASNDEEAFKEGCEEFYTSRFADSASLILLMGNANLTSDPNAPISFQVYKFQNGDTIPVSVDRNKRIEIEKNVIVETWKAAIISIKQDTLLK